MNDKDENTGANATEECEACGATLDDDTQHCAECSTALCPICRHECQDCGHTLCADCANDCYCGETLCHGCAYHCERCDTTLCTDCYRECNDCGDALCPECVCVCDRCDCDLCGRCLNYPNDYEDGYCADCANNFNTPDYADSPCWLAMQEREHMLTIGLEIEINGMHDQDRLKESPLIAGWCTDLSLDDEGREYQTRILTHEDFPAIGELVKGIHTNSTEPDKAGGHMHVRRTRHQMPSRWYWALKGLTDQQAQALNMRHTSHSRWCQLVHGDYSGKHTAVNGCHADTIELRTFARWDETTAHRLIPALEWARHMWRYFESHDPYQLKTADIMRESARSAYATPQTTPAMRLAARKED